MIVQCDADVVSEQSSHAGVYMWPGWCRICRRSSPEHDAEGPLQCHCGIGCSANEMAI